MLAVAWILHIEAKTCFMWCWADSVDLSMWHGRLVWRSLHGNYQLFVTVLNFDQRYVVLKTQVNPTKIFSQNQERVSVLATFHCCDEMLKQSNLKELV